MSIYIIYFNLIFCFAIERFYALCLIQFGLLTGFNMYLCICLQNCARNCYLFNLGRRKRILQVSHK